jgi:hypothetical protein
MVNKKTLLAASLVGFINLTLKAPAQKPLDAHQADALSTDSSTQSTNTDSQISAEAYFKNRYKGIAALLFNFTNRPWSADRVERLNGVREIIDKIVAKAQMLEEIVDHNEQIKLRDNYQHMIKDAQNLLNTYQERLGSEFAQLTAKLQEAGQAYANYLKTVEFVGGKKPRKPQPTPQVEAFDDKEWEESLAENYDIENWSRALGKEEKTKSITVDNKSSSKLYVAVYEQLKGQQPRRFGNISTIDAGSSGKVLRPEWDFTMRSNKDNNRLLYFAQEKQYLGDYPSTPSWISISEGLGFSAKTDFVIKQADLLGKRQVQGKGGPGPF